MAGRDMSGKGRALNCSAFPFLHPATARTARIIDINLFITSLDCSLGNVDQEVSDLLEFVQHIDIINTSKVIVAVAFDVDDMLLPEVISALVDIVFGIDRIGNVPEIPVLQVIYHHVVALLHKVHHLVETVEKSLVEDLLVDVLPLEDPADRLTGVTMT